MAAVSYQVGKNYRVIFNKDMATREDVSMMVHKPAGCTTRFQRERDIWVVDAIVESKVFGRPA